MSSPQLNLARKWRSKNFDEIVGQELTIKMLKNSLYLNHYFPVYLFAGQKGCGKTSTARIFAAAVNCEKLEAFQANPRTIGVPCLRCSSCCAMQQGKHPDFIEIDAASNTGVDNVRSIIDAASLLPIMGKKKIYLIDEAHMLSKAAFNAFLKLLEEPPASVLFMLATTDTQKIIETVRSRCFQLFFKPVERQALIDHVSLICAKEDIAHELSGIERIVQETGGCVRDALNLLEQVRFSHITITDNAVAQVLGYLDDAHIIELYTLAFNKQIDQLVKRIEQLDLESFSAEYVWKRFVVLVRSLVWIKSKVHTPHFKPYTQILQSLAHAHTWSDIQEISSLFFEQEITFLKTTAQHAFLHMLLLRIAQGGEHKSSHTVQSSKNTTVTHTLPSAPLPEHKEHNVSSGSKESVGQHAVTSHVQEFKQQWQSFLADVALLQDPLVNSIFMQGSCGLFNAQTGVLQVEFCKEMVFFKDWLDNTCQIWHPLLQKHFGANVSLQPEFSGVAHRADGKDAVDTSDKKKIDTSIRSQSTGYVQPNQKGITSVKQQNRTQDKHSLDISDTQKWKKTHMLLRYFPGIVRELCES